MRKVSLIAIIFLSILAFQPVYATSGACSSHGSINCSAGQDTDGSVICNDGWLDSTVMYRDIRYECNESFKPFTDVDNTNPNNEAIITMFEKAIIIGYPDLTFKPENEINRVEFLKILIEGIGVTPDLTQYKNCFPDVADDWYAPYVCYAKEQGWVEGYPDGNFKPVNAVNKVEATKMLLETQKFAVPEAINTAPFTDVTTDQWFAPYVSVAKEKGLYEEAGIILNPGQNMTRAGITEMTYRAIMINENNLNSFTEFTPIEEVTIGEVPDVQISSISLDLFWTNWDSDAEDDGIRVSAYFKDNNEELIYPQIKDWTISVQVYNAEYQGLDRIKSDLLYSHEFSQSEVKYETILGSPYIRVPKEEIINPNDEYGWVEVTFSSPTYDNFSAIDDFTRIKE